MRTQGARRSSKPASRRSEAAIGELRAELEAARAASIRSAAPSTATAPAGAPAQSAEGFRVGATTIRINGFFKVNAIVRPQAAARHSLHAERRRWHRPIYRPQLRARRGAGRGELETVGVLAGFAALRFAYTDQLRSTLTASFEDVDYPDVLVLLTLNESAYSFAGNLFYSPVRSLDLGIEYRHGVRRLLNGQDGKLDRVEAAAKYSF